jgi:hypothetical protein
MVSSRVERKLKLALPRKDVGAILIPPIRVLIPLS